MTRTLTLASSLAFATLAAVLAGSSGAQAKSTLQCHGDSRSEVVKCCDEIAGVHKPLWMLQSHTSCAAAAQCSVKTVPGTSITHVTKPKKVVVCGIYPPNWKGNGPQPGNPPPRKDPAANRTTNLTGKP
jgi:hypothetical protein